MKMRTFNIFGGMGGLKMWPGTKNIEIGSTTCLASTAGDLNVKRVNCKFALYNFVTFEQGATDLVCIV